MSTYVNRRGLPRRRLLQAFGLGAGAELLAPMLAGVLPHAVAQPGAGASAKRIIFYLDPLGVPPEWRPKASGTGIDLGAFTGLAPYVDRLTVVAGMYNPFNLHLHGNRWPLSVTNGSGTGEDILPGGPSIDRALAQTLGKNDAISSLHLNAWPARDVTYAISADGPGKPYPVHADPVAAYAAAFGSFGGGGGDAAAAAADRLARDKSVLDFVTDDVKRLDVRLGASEKVKLEQYLESLRGVEQKLSLLATAGLGCAKPAAPGANVTVGGTRTSDPPPVPERMAANLDVLASALICNLTHVAVLRVPAAPLYFLGGAPAGMHQMWHEAKTYPQLQQAYWKYSSDNMATLWKRLAAVPEGEGTMADHSLIVWINTSGGQHHNGAYDYWAMVLGRGGGAFKGGRYVVLPSSAMTANDLRLPAAEVQRAPGQGRQAPVRCVADLFVTLARALGVSMTTFGDPKHNQGPLPGLA